MELGIQSIRAAAREVAVARMKDACVITRGKGEGVRDPETGTVTYPDPEPLYGPDIAPHNGKCRIRMAYAAGAALVDAGAVTVMQQTHISVPADVVLQRGDKITVSASDNPLLVDAKFTVKSLPSGSQQSANRYGIEAVH